MLPSKANVDRYLQCDAVCPYCGSISLAGHPPEINISVAWRNVQCLACGQEWRDEYRLVAISVANAIGERSYSDEAKHDGKRYSHEPGYSESAHNALRRKRTDTSSA